MNLLADKVKVNGLEVEGPLNNNINTVSDLVSRLLTFLVPLSLVILLLVFIWGGYDFLLSGGNPQKVKSGKAKLTAGIIGIFLIISAYVLTKLLVSIFGLGVNIM